MAWSWLAWLVATLLKMLSAQRKMLALSTPKRFTRINSEALTLIIQGNKGDRQCV
jgi:hypothetical protein